MDYQECHTVPDWSLVCRIDGDTITLARTGSHSDIFNGRAGVF
ncbi:MAG TPA: type II toxin-antitoxin system mRNA interferase toxin, RelE/StbE family [Candidatus Rifleibacterium sp.]|nr:type II toxin-antitoxin system mRNA interferase toxin, RelE/StbE family [Candidatus Rifleibacterium sp.]HNW10599.1 type II toxin-antitoxin system mRNA interferase toxin, RelE/StbE family [Candidatus Rifleibacterium sp.]HOI92267.1 type II toxin-antitoxin system mRNA interferase toxin, RelE/StbE family [Candidatus Rifleibacterium sp.]HPW57941.1 type II toxin-antitoxin system mRNA interferase toxin, RelE/StbE family [Candidatus Rifleibacterium sp.]